MGIFNYILRLSLWRPREVLKLFARVVDFSVSCKKSVVNDEALRRLLAEKGRENIIQEFIKEYEYAFENLSEVLHHFDHGNMVVDFEDFCKKLSNIRFITSFAYDTEKNVNNRLKILYQLGVVGLYYDEKIAESKALGHHICFVFNEGLYPLETILESKTPTRAKIIFNPALQKTLALEYNVTELIGDYSWEYIQENHVRRESIRRV